MTTCVFVFFVKLTERCQHATPHLFCVKEVTRQQGNIATTAETSSFLACLCAVKVAELWDRLTWCAWTVFCFLRTTSWTLTQVGLEVSKVRLPSTTSRDVHTHCCAMYLLYDLSISSMPRLLFSLHFHHVYGQCVVFPPLPGGG